MANTSWSVHDAVELNRLGTTAAVKVGSPSIPDDHRNA